MRCIHCGKEWADTLQPMRFCPYCGQSLENSIPVEEPNPDPGPVSVEETAAAEPAVPVEAETDPEPVPVEDPAVEEPAAEEPAVEEPAPVPEPAPEGPAKDLSAKADEPAEPAEPAKPAVQEPIPIVYAEPVPSKDEDIPEGVLKACNTILILGIVALAGNSLTNIGALIVAKIAEKKFDAALKTYHTLGKRAYIGRKLAKIGKILAIVSLLIAAAFVSLIILIAIIAAIVALITNT